MAKRRVHPFGVVNKLDEAQKPCGYISKRLVATDLNFFGLEHFYETLC